MSSHSKHRDLSSISQKDGELNSSHKSQKLVGSLNHPSKLPLCFINYSSEHKTSLSPSSIKKSIKTIDTKVLSKGNEKDASESQSFQSIGIEDDNCWSFLVGGKYNSPRWVNADYSPKQSQYHQKLSIEKVESREKEDPFVREMKKDLNRKSIEQHFISEMPTSSHTHHSKDDITIDIYSPLPPESLTIYSPRRMKAMNLSISSEVKDSQMKSDANESFPPSPSKDTSKQDVKLPKIKSLSMPKKHVKKQQRQTLETKGNDINTYAFSFKEFDKATMYHYGNEAYDKLLDPQNFPIDLYPTIDYLRTRKNMMRSNYRVMVPNRVQKQFTPYRHYVNYRMAIEHLSDNSSAKARARFLPTKTHADKIRQSVQTTHRVGTEKNSKSETKAKSPKAHQSHGLLLRANAQSAGKKHLNQDASNDDPSEHTGILPSAQQKQLVMEDSSNDVQYDVAEVYEVNEIATKDDNDDDTRENMCAPPPDEFLSSELSIQLPQNNDNKEESLDIGQ